jgi:hypothetical protein
MASKTVWIVGGVVVAIGAIAYLSYNKAPAGKDAAGTIVEAKRARADGTNSFNPAPTASTTEQNAADVAKGTAVADAANAADAAAAAGSASGNAKKGMDAKSLHSSDSADAAAAARGINPSAQIRSNASAKSAAMASQTSAMDGADKH